MSEDISRGRLAARDAVLAARERDRQSPKVSEKSLQLIVDLAWDSQAEESDRAQVRRRIMEILDGEAVRLGQVAK